MKTITWTGKMESEFDLPFYEVQQRKENNVTLKKRCQKRVTEP
jgi:hypothetical protein